MVMSGRRRFRCCTLPLALVTADKRSGYRMGHADKTARASLARCAPGQGPVRHTAGLSMPEGCLPLSAGLKSGSGLSGPDSG